MTDVKVRGAAFRYYTQWKILEGSNLKPRSSIRTLSVLLMVLHFAGCSSLLPKASSATSPFSNFDEARKAIESLVPMTSNVADLTRMGIDPVAQPNTIILTQADIVRRFIPSSLLKREDLDPGVWACVEARDDCRGWEITASHIEKKRTGNFLADFANFSRRSETTGWRFNAIVLLVKDKVVYRTWGGQPSVNELEVNTNPLGPLQELGPSVIMNTH